jgi:hypothetical protein
MGNQTFSFYLQPYDREEYRNSGHRIGIKELQDKIDRGLVISLPY